MITTKQIANQANEWIGESNRVTGASIDALIWAMAMDPPLCKMIITKVRDQQAEYEALRLADGG